VLPSEKPPLAAWPKCAFPGEGAHGWFQRLAVANGQISARTLAESQGLNGRHPRPASYLDYCLRFPVANPDALIEATPVLDRGVVVLRGQSFHIRSTSPSIGLGCARGVWPRSGIIEAGSTSSYSGAVRSTAGCSLAVPAMTDSRGGTRRSA